MKVECEIADIELEGDYGGMTGEPPMIPSVCATCSRCGHETESYGTSEASIRRCLVLMREECELEEKNFYTCEELED